MAFNEAEALQRANQGDVNAMLELSFFYGGENKFIDAAEWADKAADAGSLKGYLFSMLMNKAPARQSTAFGALGTAKDYWQKVYDRGNMVQSLCAKGQSELTPERQQRVAQLVAGSIEESRVGIAQILYFEEGDGNQYDADILSLLKGINNPEALTLAGIIYDGLDDFETSYSILNKVIRDREYAASSKKWTLEQRIFEIACLILASYYRIGVPGTVQPNLAAAKAILDSSMPYVTTDEGKKAFQEELSHYRQKLFGGYKYV